MINAIGFVELNSIAKGMEVADQMLKTANVELIFTSVICPGKYVTFIHGDVGSVENSVKIAKEIGKEFIVDDLVIPNIDEQIFSAITGNVDIKEIKSVGVIESFTMASLISAADTCLEASGVELVELRIGSGIGGKSYVVMTGDVADVNASVDAGVNAIKGSGNIVNFTVIASPHADFKKALL